MRFSTAANLDRNEALLPLADRNDRRLDVCVDVPVSQFPAGAKMASGRNSLRVVGDRGNVDAVSHSKVMPHYYVLKAMTGALALAIFALLETVTSWGTVAIGLVSASSAVIAIVVKEWFESKRQRRTASLENHRTDAQSILEREKLVDDRNNTFIAEMKTFHGEQVKGLMSQVALSKELLDQERTINAQQRELITQQATTIQQLRNPKEVP